MAKKMLGDLDKIIKWLDKAGRLARVKTPVDTKHELAAVAARFEAQSRAVLFEQVKGHDAPVFTGLYWSRELMADLFGVKEGNLHRFISDCTSRWRANPMDPVVVDTAPVKQVTQATPDLTRLPVPTHALKDGGPYLDVSVVVSKDPQTGIRNASIQRFMVAGPDTLGILIDPGRHLGVHLEKARAKGESLPFTLNVGVGPGVHFAAATPSGAAPLDSDELGIASEYQGSPLELVAGDTAEVEMIAHAMFALECEILPDELIEEGPFAEVTGLYAARAPRPRVRVKAIHHRRKPVFHTLLCGAEVWNSAGLMAEGHLFNLLPNQIPGITDIYFTRGGAVFNVVIQLQQKHAGWSKLAIMAAFASFPMLKFVTVVDEDVDIRNPHDVEWAMCNRLVPKTGIIQIDEAFGLGLNPTFPDNVGGKVGFDCTRPVPRRDKDDRISYKNIDLADYDISL